MLVTFSAFATQQCQQRPNVLRLSVHQERERSCYHDSSWTAWAISMKLKLTWNIHQHLWMIWLDCGGQRSRSRSQQTIEVAKASTSMLGHKIPSSNNIYLIYTDICANSFCDRMTCTFFSVYHRMVSLFPELLSGCYKRQCVFYQNVHKQPNL